MLTLSYGVAGKCAAIRRTGAEIHVGQGGRADGSNAVLDYSKGCP